MKELLITNKFPLFEVIVDDDDIPGEGYKCLVVIFEFLDGRMAGVDQLGIFCFGVGAEYIQQS